MKYAIYLLIPAFILASCGGQKQENNQAKLTRLKKERSDLDVQIQKLEKGAGADTSKKPNPVSITTVQRTTFNSFIEVESHINGDENILASPQSPGVVKVVLVHPGQRVSKGQVLATLDAAAVEQQVQAQDVQLSLAKSLYEKQQKLWAQNIGTEVQLLQAKTNYEALQKQKAATVAQRNMYRIVSPISGTVDQVTIKEGDIAQPGGTTGGIRVVSFDKLKAEATLGENYLGKVKTGDPVMLVFPDLNDSIKTNLSYVAQSVDNISRAFLVQVRLANNSKLRPNMSCKMKIANYENTNAIVIPVSSIQKTAEGEMVYIADGNKAKSVYIKTGRISNGLAEVLSGLNAGDKVVTEGYEDLDNGEPIQITN
ncbi:efflux RND transporter periplasmic adaptor subunit [Chitinophagaceae bacterium MMS25-I14]